MLKKFRKRIICFFKGHQWEDLAENESTSLRKRTCKRCEKFNNYLEQQYYDSDTYEPDDDPCGNTCHMGCSP
jgi:hypothetical protein